MTSREIRKQQSRQMLLNAALQLSTQKGALSHVSLREVTRASNLVPAAFYRHFNDFTELGIVLAEQAAAQCLPALLKQLRQGYALSTARSSHTPTTSKTSNSIALIFHCIDEAPLFWKFLIIERSSSIPEVRDIIEHHIQVFGQALAHDLAQLDDFKHLSVQDTDVLTELFINLTFSWSVEWLNLPNPQHSMSLFSQQTRLIERATRQAKLLVHGVSHIRA